MKKKKKTFKSIINSTITILIVTNILLGIYDFLEYGSRRKKTQWNWYGYAYCPNFENRIYYFCRSNIHYLQGAVEMYNMDNTPMMTELDLKRLIDSHYLKEEVKGSEPECRYYSQGDLTNDGVICCELHGCLTASATSKIAKEREKKLAEEKYKDELFISCARALAPILYLMFALMQ